MNDITISADHHNGLLLAVEAAADLRRERHELEILLQTVDEKLRARPAEPGIALALLSAARFCLANSDTLEELTGIVTGLAHELGPEVRA
jgi:hypothetical protein